MALVERSVGFGEGLNAKRCIEMPIVKKVAGDCKPGLVGDGAFARDVEPAVAGDEAVEADLVDLVCYGLVAPDLKTNIAGVGATEASSWTVYAASGLPL